MTRFALALLLVPASLAAADPTPAERGKKALESTAFIKAFWPKQAYDNAWKVWGLKEKPKEYEAAVRERYGLHPAPYKNGDYPMGLRQADLLLGSGVGIDCMTCHGGSIIGKSTVGLGNTVHSTSTPCSRTWPKPSGNPVKPPFAVQSGSRHVARRGRSPSTCSPSASPT